MHPVLVDRSELEKQGFVKPLDDLCFAFHDDLRYACAARRKGAAGSPCRRGGEFRQLEVIFFGDLW